MSNTDLDLSRDAYDRRQWRRAYELLTLLDQRTGLAPDDVELLGRSAYLIGRDTEFLRYMERACNAHGQSDDPSSAARCAFWSGLILLLEGEVGQANGWLARARRLVDGIDCVERGYILLPEAEQSLLQGKSEAALKLSRTATEIGQRFGDADLVALARHVHGRALILHEQVHEGLAVLDELMISVSSSELSAMVVGLLYCSVIDACQQVYATSRAAEWTAALGRWCDQDGELVPFKGICQLRRAEIMQFHGDWSSALQQAQEGHERITSASDRKLTADLFYREGEIHRLRGELTVAEEAYQNAGRLGSEAQPGLALLRMAQGRREAAWTSIRRVLGMAPDALQRAALLPTLVEIALVIGDLLAAQRAVDELEEISRRYATESLKAMAAHARGLVQLAEGQAAAALISLRRAFESWERENAPYESARARRDIGLVCRELGDEEAALREFASAAEAFGRLGAERDADVTRRLSASPADLALPRLTQRELQVLRGIAAGKTNDSIATELRLSTRTVDRHVSNLLTKLGVPSRAAATAFACKHQLL